NFQRLEGFVERFRKVASDSHCLAHRFHLGSEFFIYIGELFKVKSRSFNHHIVDGWFKTSRGARQRSFLLIQIITYNLLGSKFSDSNSGSLRSQRRRSAYARVDFDSYKAVAAGLYGKLYIAASGKGANGAHHFDGRITQHLILFVGEGLCRGYGNRIAGMYAQRVDVLDGTDNDNVVIFIAQQLNFKFLPAEDRFFNEYAVNRTHFQSAAYFFFKLIFRPNDTAAGPAHSKGRPNNNR